MGQVCNVCNGTGMVKTDEVTAQVIKGSEITYECFGVCTACNQRETKASGQSKAVKPHWTDKYKPVAHDD
jgi:hypothetical protein